jgi:hypothetical protein
MAPKNLSYSPLARMKGHAMRNASLISSPKKMCKGENPKEASLMKFRCLVPKLVYETETQNFHVVVVLVVCTVALQQPMCC